METIRQDIADAIGMVAWTETTTVDGDANSEPVVLAPFDALAFG